MLTFFCFMMLLSYIALSIGTLFLLTAFQEYSKNSDLSFRQLYKVPSFGNKLDAGLLLCWMSLATYLIASLYRILKV
jgi:hypothetical protein